MEGAIALENEMMTIQKTLTIGRVIFGMFGIFHWRRIVVVVLDGGEIGSGYLWHMIDNVRAVVVDRQPIVH